jgi:protein TonB
VAAWIERHRVYPDAARRQGEQGQVLVRLTLDPSGHVTQATLMRESGAPALDAAALDLLRGAAMPAPPASGSEARNLTVSLRYRLE